MRKAVKGALLSALVFPGIGQILLKRVQRGVLFLVSALAALVVMIAKVVHEALGIIDALIAEGGVVDPEALSRAASHATGLSDDPLFNGLQVLFIIIWIYGIIDAYGIGKQWDLKEGEAGNGKGKGE